MLRQLSYRQTVGILVAVGLVVIFATTLGMMIATAGCTPTEERLFNKPSELKGERTRIIDDMYKIYGGGKVIESIADIAEYIPLPLPDPVEETTTGVLAESDRAIFELQVNVSGKGEHVWTLTPKAREYFAREEVKLHARRVAELNFRIKRIENKLEALRDAKTRDE